MRLTAGVGTALIYLPSSLEEFKTLSTSTVI